MTVERTVVFTTNLHCEYLLLTTNEHVNNCVQGINSVFFNFGSTAGQKQTKHVLKGQHTPHNTNPLVMDNYCVKYHHDPSRP